MKLIIEFESESDDWIIATREFKRRLNQIIDDGELNKHVIVKK